MPAYSNCWILVVIFSSPKSNVTNERLDKNQLLFFRRNNLKNTQKSIRYFSEWKGSFSTKRYYPLAFSHHRKNSKRKHPAQSDCANVNKLNPLLIYSCVHNASKGDDHNIGSFVEIQGVSLSHSECPAFSFQNCSQPSAR